MKLVRMLIEAAEAAAGKMLRLSGSGRAGESFTGIVSPQAYGMGSCPPAGAVAMVSMDKNQVLSICTEDARYRIALQPGEAAIYTDEGDSIHLKRGNEIHIKTDKLVVDFANSVELGAGASGQVVTTECICSFTGSPHPEGSTKIKVVK